MFNKMVNKNRTTSFEELLERLQSLLQSFSLRNNGQIQFWKKLFNILTRGRILRIFRREKESPLLDGKSSLKKNKLTTIEAAASRFKTRATIFFYVLIISACLEDLCWQLGLIFRHFAALIVRFIALQLSSSRSGRSFDNSARKKDSRAIGFAGLANGGSTKLLLANFFDKTLLPFASLPLTCNFIARGFISDFALCARSWSQDC